VMQSAQTIGAAITVPLAFGFDFGIGG